ncbi:MAG: hypothetical protein A3C43_09895 [Candidatus Schekmanbacteria bacterium RIFCSPHIGHO2_02_FULL_38_11]|uniref:(Fe-S)-binding protein n=1 Tax=Candidatus Schekmanbacteria bacterium RIFCSPLOWO2_12_FULL_38_15 TaxID=1817883 RepID=A0A1F7SKX7_9BACT|nr:MAG: hypothetical protein A2043_11810 [Candidatus Schekmanbacteria bacterium GWA2_38_9]OGL48200.1 MAG: hypothetical protein A3H37_04585 [Candidatus Schekmanbacteria bacterium RIFCSPLOWO2_02_FULL_38_14]OGL54430.1 MAG: hypothetical protein A3G31_12390 [Candidatus Schekmanbacteria bacterium RIFCSPLOWO2_12_FULL_38_15]OGL54647.1 MAG: hypothetical protein A3C43_09895 [Candidatus Schekmanbacteria bacterium RIFCSPHIGHO2_02_FULL_38_11]
MIMKSLEKYKWDLVNCERCSMCKWVHPWRTQSHRFAKVCPSVSKYLFDAYSAQGRFDVIRGLLEGEIEVTDKVLEVLYACTLCGGCDVTCKFSRDMEPLEILHQIRIELVKAGKGPLPAHKAGLESIKNYDNPWQQPRTRRSNWARKVKVKDITKEKAKILYYAGCTYSYNPDVQIVAQNTLSLLLKAGLDIGILGNKEICCASPALKVGAEDVYHDFAKKNIETFNSLGVEKVITSCAGCFGIFTNHYPEIGKMNFEVVQGVQLIEKMLIEGKLDFKKKVPLTVTWHDPCHMGRGGEPQNIWDGTRTKWGLSDPPRTRNFGNKGVYDPPRNILKAIPGLKFVEMERIREYSWCCGAGGGVKSAFPEFALWSSRERVEEAKSTGADALVTACPWCELNFDEGIKADGNKIKMISLINIVTEALGE